MGHRLSKIYTRTGDAGDTGLGDGNRVAKDSLRVEAYGTTDELNSVIGTVLAHSIPADVRDSLNDIQHDLFDIGGELCMPGVERTTEQYVTRLETTLDTLNEPLPMLKEFILPAGGHATAACHLARTVCRRAERNVVSLNREEIINPYTIAYLNRLSDLLFVMSRVIVRAENGSEVLWSPGQSSDK